VAQFRRVGGFAYRPDTPWDEPSENSPEFNAFLTGELLNYDPWTRIRGQARGGSLPREAQNGLTRVAILLAMLSVDPNQRITMDAVKSHPWCMT
jgi:serine/threonine-protein kinase Chk1